MNTTPEQQPSIFGLDPFSMAETRLAGLRMLVEDGAQLSALLDAEAEIASLRAQLANGQISPSAASSAIAQLVSSVEQSALQPKQHAVTSVLAASREQAHAFLANSAEQVDTLWKDALSLYGDDVTEEERQRLEALRQDEFTALETGELEAAFEARSQRLDILEDVFERNGDEPRFEAVRSHRAEIDQEAAQLRAAESRETDASQTVSEDTLATQSHQAAANDEDIGSYFTALGLADFPEGSDVRPCSTPRSGSDQCRQP